jgi:hypothetical protein
MRWSDDAAIGIAGLLTLAITLVSGCSYALREPAMRACAQAEVAVEFCKAGTCGSSSMRNAHDEEWSTVEEWQRQAEQVCELQRAIEAGRLRK